MGYVDLVEDTICALVTAPGPAGISVIRISGPRSFDILKKLATFLPSAPESHRIYFGTIKDSESQPLDEVLVSYFQKGKSFTGDETLEISTHGGFMTANRVLREIVALGIRPAERGEFSFRAFYNGKVDLVQAEGILSLIESKSETARSIALKQLKGQLSNKFSELEDALVLILAHLEASIDFSTEDIEPHSLEDIRKLISSCLESMRGLLKTYTRGKVINDGFRMVLVGPPNVGKSSLYNLLLGEDRAIVTDIAGTTRDILEGQFTELGSSVKIVDSAGLRVTDDPVEKIGVQKSEQAMATADAIFYVCDIESFDKAELFSIKEHLDKSYFLVNKVDKLGESPIDRQGIQKFFEDQLGSQALGRVYFVSAVNSYGIQEVKDLVKDLSLVDIGQSEALITQYRHYEYLRKAISSLDNAYQLLANQDSYDLIALEVQTSLKEVFGLLGKEFDEQVLDKVFKQFCIGK